MTPKRIFWLGAHKLLVKTELVRLISLGYEVFNPPYNSPVPDQSMVKDWISPKSTLPIDIQKKLSSYNFFYNYINDDISKILNKYFDAVVVTIHPWWLSEVLRTFQGKVIYRTYGQTEILSEELDRYNAVTNVLNRKNFHFLPFHEATLDEEENWLKSKARIVPYCIDPSLNQRRNTWNVKAQKNKKIMLSCPNINNPFYLDHYNYLKKNYNEEHFLFFGVQLSKIKDKQIMGTIDYEDLKKFFLESNGYLYTYTSSRVCYLPPIEMMLVGGPVLFPKGTLLDKMMGSESIASFENVEESKTKVNKLLSGDEEFINSVLSHQSKIVEYYSEEYVWPIFDSEFKKILDSTEDIQAADCETLVFHNNKNLRNFLNSKNILSDKTIYQTKQDILNKFMLFRLRNRLQMLKVQHGVVSFSARVEKGEFIQHLIDHEVETKDWRLPKKSIKDLLQFKYFLFRLIDRSKHKISFYFEKIVVFLKPTISFSEKICLKLYFIINKLARRRISWSR
jgi:hypothetical protein